MKALGILTRVIPFVAIITLNIIAQASRYRLDMIKPFALIIGVVLIINLGLALALKMRDYFSIGLTGVATIGILSIFIFPTLGEFYVSNVISGLYLGLFLVALFPPLFKMDPFTFAFSKDDYPKAITEGEQFLKINLILNHIWTGLFALSIVLTNLKYHSDSGINTIIATFVPLALQLVIGLPLTIKLPTYLIQIVSSSPIIFKSIQDLFASMPFGLNKKAALDVDTIVQFKLSGKEPVVGYFTIKDQVCSYAEGEHPDPKTTISCDSELWVKISNNEVSGDKAYINNEYQVSGDASILLIFAGLFAPPKKKKRAKPVTNETTDFQYKTFPSNKIQNIVVFDGGFRNSKFSKTLFMVNHFMEGAKQAGANVEYFKLKDYDIKDCSGCYNCWTKSPGTCIYKDDMTMFRKKYREADLVVFASPLYIFNVTGILKTFMDRLLPIMKPYMLMNDQGNIAHPDRYPEAGEQGFVVFSAAGFPEVKHNFDGLTGMFHCWDSHSENTHLMGEFYLTAAELIAQPVYADRRKLVEDVCFAAGKQIVVEGRVDPQAMLSLQDSTVSKETFQMQADSFWESLDGKKPYLKGSPKL